MISESPPPYPPIKASGTQALDWIGMDAHGARILATAQRLLDAEQEARQTLPPGVAEVCRVARIEKQRMTLAVPSAAYASKLRQLLPRVLTRLNQSGWNLSEITVRVQGALLQTPPRPQRETEPLGPEALDAFDQLQESLPPGPLSDAVRQLLKHHR